MTGWQLNSGASEAAIHEATTLLGYSLPSDYVQLLQQYNGGEGFIGENYLILWKAEELGTFNREYEVKHYAPGLVLFGSNGGGEAYALDMRNDTMPVVRVPFIGMELSYARVLATTLTSLLRQLANHHDNEV